MTTALNSERQPVVAGTFYPSHPLQLKTSIEKLLERRLEPVSITSAIVPHAGYIYSGTTAGRTLASVHLPKKLILLCPNHTGHGDPVACWPGGNWHTPLGSIPVDEKIVSELLKASPLFTADTEAHTSEHSAEVILPFLQVLLEEFSFVPVCIGIHSLKQLQEIGKGIAKVIDSSEENIAIIVSSDMNHYENAQTNRTKDEMALNAIKNLDPEELHRVVISNNITMCGFACAIAALVASLELGSNRSDIVSYTHSGMMTGDDSQVVSYAGVRIWKE